MSANEAENWAAGVPLDEAWLAFIDIETPGWGRRENYIAILRPARNGVPEDNPDLLWTMFEPKDAEQREAKREHWERSFKQELLLALRRGSLRAYGRPWMPEQSEREVLVPSNIFDPDTTPPPEIEWSAGYVSARGRAYSDIRVATASPEKLPQDENSPADCGSLVPTMTSKVSRARSAMSGGRPNFEADFKAKVRDVVAAQPDFLTRGTRGSQAREIKARLYGEGARNQDDMSGCNIDTAKRWIGEVAHERK